MEPNDIIHAPTTPEVAIATFKEFILSRPDVGFLRTDTEFILRFLRARKYKPQEAFEVFLNYYHFMHRNHSFYAGYNVNNPEVRLALENGLPAVLKETDSHGRRIIVMYTAQWDWNRFPITAIHRAICLSLDELLNDIMVQEKGVVMIIDWSGFTFRQYAKLQISSVRLVVDSLEYGYPVRFKAVHSVGQSWYVEATIAVLKPFLINKEKIHFHGHNLSNLHKFVTKDVLPTELGGERGPYQSGVWIDQLLKSSKDSQCT